MGIKINKCIISKGKPVVIVFLLILFVGLHKELCKNTLISFYDLCLYAVIPTLFTCMVLLKKGVGSLFRNLFTAGFIVIILLVIWSFILLTINYIPTSTGINVEQFAIIHFTEKSDKRGTHAINVFIMYRGEKLKVEVPFQPIEEITQYDELKLKTRKGLLGIEIITGKELLKNNKIH